MDSGFVEKAAASGDDCGPGYEQATNAPPRPLGNSEFPVPSLGLPSLKTGIGWIVSVLHLSITGGNCDEKRKKIACS